MPLVDEQARLAALRRYRILDTEPEEAFDDLTLLASYICNTPMALITLIDENRQWFKSQRGLEGVRETERSVAFCTHAIPQSEILEVPDTREDERFRNNPFVTGQPHIRFYAGAPLITPDGHALGTLCVVDTQPRRLTPEQIRALDALRHQAQAQLELRRRYLELKQTLADRDKLTDLMAYTDTCEMNIVVPAEPESIPKVSQGVKQLLEGKGWGEDQIVPVELALDEAMANAIRHGCKNDPTKHVQCLVTTNGQGEVVIAVRDPGPGFEPAKVPNPLEGDNVFKGSGRGVFLINQLMDEVGFADGGREVQMRKRRT